MKIYSNSKKCLYRLLYINKKGLVISVRDTGTKSRRKFQNRINIGIFK